MYRVVCGTQVSLGCSWRRCLSALSGSPTHSLKRSCQVRETKRNHTQTHILSCLGLVCCTCVHCTLRYEKRALPRQARDKHKGKIGNKKRLFASVALAGRSLGRTCLACQHHNHQQCQHRKGSHLTQRYTSFKLVLNFCVVELKQNRILWSLLLSAEGTEGST